MKNYIHGYEECEQSRLLRQALYWKSLLIKKLTFEPNMKVLEIGCGVGAAMKIVASASPKTCLFGLDVHYNQTISARNYLQTLSNIPTLVTADARHIPFPSKYFDCIYSIWLMEHITHYEEVIEEACRLLKIGGLIKIIETDYSTFQLYPSSTSYEYLRRALFQYFDSFGNPVPNLYLPKHLENAGFRIIESGYEGFTFFNDENLGVKQHILNVSEFLEPIVPILSKRLGCDYKKLCDGVSHMLSIANDKDAIFVEGVYSIVAKKALDD